MSLYLHMQVGGSIVIDGHIIVTVAKNARRGRVTLGVDAPDEIPVNRDVVQQKIEDAKAFGRYKKVRRKYLKTRHKEVNGNR